MSESAQTEVEIRHNREDSRYEAHLDGVRVGFLQYRLGDGRTTLLHTEVDDRYAGHGIGSRLAQAALEGARADGLAVVPICPFVVAAVRREPERYLDLVEPSLRARVTAADEQG